MKHFVEIGSTPGSEPCAQVGSPTYETMARMECRAMMNLLRRLFGQEPDGAKLQIKSNPHDFGTYLEVVCWYDDAKDASVDYAFKCEGEGPEIWDKQALAELRAAGYSVKDPAADPGVKNPLLGGDNPYWGIG